MTTTKQQRIDALADAANDANGTIARLQAALHTATAVEALVILPLIERAALLRRDIGVLATALKEN